MAVSLSRLFGPANIASGTSTVFTGTAAHTYVLRNLLVVNETSAKVTLKVGIGGVADANLVQPTTSIPSKGRIDFPVFIVMSGTETLQAVTSATGLTITGSGLDIT